MAVQDDDWENIPEEKLIILPSKPKQVLISFFFLVRTLSSSCTLNLVFKDKIEFVYFVDRMELSFFFCRQR
jgi:hypothetical protein